MSDKLVAYFSASGITKKFSERLAGILGADLYEILPEVPYTEADLDWTDKGSRSSDEMADESFRAPMAAADADIAGHDVIFIGFPIWWHREPSIIDTFIEAYDFAGKTVVPFCTSGGSSMADADIRFEKMLGQVATLKRGLRFSPGATDTDIQDWVDSLKL